MEHRIIASAPIHLVEHQVTQGDGKLTAELIR